MFLRERLAPRAGPGRLTRYRRIQAANRTSRFARLLLACLEHLLASAGNAALMTPQLRAMLCEHAAGNYRVLTTMAAQLLGAALQRQAPVIDEKLYFDVFGDARRPDPVKPRARVTR